MLNANQPRSASAIQDYRAQYPDPIDVPINTVVRVDREDSDEPGWWWCIAPDARAGWVPAVLLDPAPSPRTLARVRSSYSARELSITRGEPLAVEHEYCGWLFVRNGAGVPGWVPATHVQCSS
jgi:hypothetical protein